MKKPIYKASKLLYIFLYSIFMLVNNIRCAKTYLGAKTMDNQPEQPQYPQPQEDQQATIFPRPGYTTPLLPPPPPPKAKISIGTWALFIIVVFFCSMVSYVAGTVNGAINRSVRAASTPSTMADVATQAPQKPQTPTPTPKPPTPTPTPKPKVWTTTHSFSGSNQKKTEVFTVPDEWKIKYTCTGMGDGFSSNFALTVYGSDGSYIDLAANLICKDGNTTADETLEHQGGSVYLDIAADGPWTIDVQEMK